MSNNGVALDEYAFNERDRLEIVLSERALEAGVELSEVAWEQLCNDVVRARAVPDFGKWEE